MRQLRATTLVILGIGVFAFGIPAVERAVAQPAPARVGPPPQATAPRSPAERDFDVDWHQAPGRPSVLSGCVYNRYGAQAQRVRVGVEGLDAKGAVVASTAAWVGNVPAGSYGHFELPVLAGASNYRIRVLAHEWSIGG